MLNLNLKQLFKQFRVKTTHCLFVIMFLVAYCKGQSCYISKIEQSDF
jgi:hypothetical protein